MQPSMRKLLARLPAAREELTKLQIVLKQLDRVERLANKGKLNQKELESVYRSLPPWLRPERSVRPAIEDLKMPRTTKLVAELNRVIVLARDGKGNGR
jgi:hypothetical protein